jgi:hypothetical protein
MAGMAAVSNLRKFSSGGYRYPNRANLLVLFRMILLSIYKVDVAQIQRTSRDKCYRIVTKYESKDSYPYSTM